MDIRKHIATGNLEIVALIHYGLPTPLGTRDLQSLVIEWWVC